MFKMFGYLKKHAGSVALIIGLLIIQAVGDLALPQYTANIVDVGIQQGGIESGMASVIRQSQMQRLMLFMTGEERQAYEDAYKTMDAEDAAEKYTIADTVTLKELKEKDKEKLSELEYMTAMPMVLVNFLTADTDEAKAMREKMFSGMEGTLPEGADVFSVIETLPEESRLQMREQTKEQMGAMSQMMLSQMSVAFVKAEYEAIGINMEAVQNSYLWQAGLKMLGISLLIMLTMILVGFLASKVGAKIGVELRTAVFGKVVSFSNAEIDRFSTASLITRSTNDIQQVQMVLIMLLRMVFYAPILGIGGILKVLNSDASMGWIIVVAVAGILCLVAILFAVAMPKFKIMQTLVDRVNLVMREILTGLPVIRAFSTERYEEKRFEGANKDVTKTMLFTSRAMAFMMPAMMLIMNCIMLMIVWFGAKGIDLGNMQVGDMIAFMSYTMQIVMSFLMITMVSIMLPRAVVSANRINEVIETKTTVLDGAEHKQPEAGKEGLIEFSHVSFRYPNAMENVLEDIHFTARPGETTAFIGSTGSGKSTLINLIPRFYDVSEGNIKIGGVDVRDMAKHELRDKIGYVPQKGVLFSGTIASNLRYGKEEAADREIENAAQIAQAEEFVLEKAEKYQSEISQGGANVSGGQKQRLSIARAIVKRPKIYIFDDSFSALDYKTDITLRKALKKETADSTVLIVAQRISTILHAEQIIVLDEGKIAGIGTHKELLRDNEIYRQIAGSQLSQEELMAGGAANA